MKFDLIQSVGWLSSLALVPSLGYQTYTQWKEKTVRGVSIFLYVGGLLASVGFVTYSWMTKDKVFMFTNSLLAINNILGLCIHLKYRKPK